MGEAAEWEIWRRYGVDISDDGHLERHYNGPRRKRDPFDEILRRDPEWNNPTKKRKGNKMGDGWQHKDDYPDGGDGVDPQDYGTERQRSHYGIGPGEGNYEARKYKVHVHRRDRGSKVVYIERGTNRGGAFVVMDNGVTDWYPQDEQSVYVKQLARDALTEVRPGAQYRVARGIVDNALSFSPNAGITIKPQFQQAPEYKVTRATEGTENMNNINAREAVTLIQLEQGARLYGIKFMAEGFVKPDQKTYTYKDIKGLDLAMLDLVVVEARDAYSIAQVVEIDRSPLDSQVDLGKLRHIVQKIDLDAHREYLNREDSAVNKLAMAEVSERLDKYRSQMGGQRFNEVAALLSGGERVSPSISPDVAPGTYKVTVNNDGQLINSDTGEVLGKMTVAGVPMD